MNLKITPQATPSPLANFLINEPVHATPLDLAQRLARATLEQYKRLDFNDRRAMEDAVIALGSELVRLLAALDADDALAVAALPDVWRGPVSA